MMMQRGPNLLMRPDVQKELKLSEEQIEKLHGMMRRGGPQPPQGGPVRGGQRGGEVRGQRGGQRGGEVRGQRGPGGPGGPDFKSILNDRQEKRYDELNLQFQGAMALMRPDVADKVGISDEQHREIRGIIGEVMGRGDGQRGGREGADRQRRGGQDGVRGQRQGRQGGFQGGPGAPPAPMNPEEMEAKKKQINEKIEALLTSKQKKTWKSMQGETFKFEKMERRAPRDGQEGGKRGGGRRGGGGGGINR
jgi:hypothetical protein